MCLSNSEIVRKEEFQEMYAVVCHKAALCDVTKGTTISQMSVITSLADYELHLLSQLCFIGFHVFVPVQKCKRTNEVLKALNTGLNMLELHRGCEQ